MTRKNPALDLKTLHDSEKPSGHYRSHSGRAICPDHNNCKFDDCPHIREHWRGTHCNKDRRDKCPTCIALQKTIMVKNNYNYNLELKSRASRGKNA